MKYIKNFKLFEAVIMPEKSENNSVVNSFESLHRYGQENGFDVVNYEDFYNSLPESDKNDAPPKHRTPFFALFHPINLKPMFVLVDSNAPRFIPFFKEIVDEIISHEKIHYEQSKRSNIEYSLPKPRDKKAYYSNKDEIMAFSWTIANGLSKKHQDLKSAMKSLDEDEGMKSRIPGNEAKIIWSDIKRYCDNDVIKRYRKYIYMYLEKIFEE